MDTIKTSEKVNVENYPYGFRLKTTLFDTMEFSPKKGYRHVTQTIDPKNGKLNAPKKSTYFRLMVRYYGEDRHINTYTNCLNGNEDINKASKFIFENFDLFTTEEITYLYFELLTASKYDFRGVCLYGGAKVEDVKEFYLSFARIAKSGLNDGLNHFDELILDAEKINAAKPADYSPFN